MKRRLFSVASLVFMVFALAGPAFADTLELNDGSIVTGTFAGRTDTSVSFEVQGITMTYPASNVKAITMGESAPAQPAAAPAPEGSAAPPQPAAESASAPTVQAGTRVIVQMKESLDSSRNKAGHVFAATLNSDLYAGSILVAPKGSQVYGRLASAKKSGRMVGKAELKVVLTDIVINGRPYPVVTSSVKTVGESSGVSTAKKTAVGAGVGALLRSDTKKGAKQGAAVGLGASILTSGEQVNIPAGTLLEFRLAEPFTPQ